MLYAARLSEPVAPRTAPPLVPAADVAPRPCVPAPLRTPFFAVRAAASVLRPPPRFRLRAAGGITGSGCSARARRCSWVVDGAVVVRANGEGGAYALAVDDDGGPGCLARRTGSASGLSGCSISRKCPRCTALGPLLRRPAPSVLDLDKLGTGGNLAVDVGVDLGVEAGCVQALIALHIGKEGGVEPAAARAGDAGSGGGLRVGSSLLNGASASER